MRRLPPATPAAVDGVVLTEAQRARLGRLILCIWRVDNRQTAAGCVAYAVDCLMGTVRRDGDAFEDRARVRMGDGRSFVVT